MTLEKPFVVTLVASNGVGDTITVYSQPIYVDNSAPSAGLVIEMTDNVAVNATTGTQEVIDTAGTVSHKQSVNSITDSHVLLAPSISATCIGQVELQR